MGESLKTLTDFNIKSDSQLDSYFVGLFSITDKKTAFKSPNSDMDFTTSLSASEKKVSKDYIGWSNFPKFGNWDLPNDIESWFPST